MDHLTAVLSLFCLLSAFITYGLGIAAYVKNPRSSVNRLFLLAMVAATYWGFCEFMIWQAGSAEGVTFWLKASSLWPFVIAFIIHFILTLTSQPAFNKNHFLSLAVIYLPACVISLILFFTDWIFVVRFIPGTGYTYLPVKDSISYQGEAAYILLMMLYGAFVIFTFWQHATTKMVKKQAMLICTAIFTVIFFGFLSGILLPAFGIYIPNLVFIGIVIFSLFITVAIQKHELFILSPRTAVPDILRTMPDAMILADINGRIISANDATGKIFGLNEKELPGKMIGTCIPEPAFTQIRTAVLEKRSVIDMETVPAGTASGTISIAGSLVQDSYGEPAGMVLIVRDITDRKTVEKALRIAGEKISLLTRVTRHDINNLISALSGYLLLIKDNPVDPENATYISTSMQIVERIHQQLMFTREYQEIGAHQPVWQSLEQIVSRAIMDLSHDGIIIERKTAGVEILVDPLSVKVLYNLLENAIRHGEHITRIRITTQEQNDKALHIFVEDDGIGILAEDKERIFRYGYGKNTGLGLAISRDILSLTGITISETGIAGSGARFEIIVPHSAWRPLRP